MSFSRIENNDFLEPEVEVEDEDEDEKVDDMSSVSDAVLLDAEAVAVVVEDVVDADVVVTAGFFLGDLILSFAYRWFNLSV